MYVTKDDTEIIQQIDDVTYNISSYDSYRVEKKKRDSEILTEKRENIVISNEHSTYIVSLTK